MSLLSVRTAVVFLGSASIIAGVFMIDAARAATIYSCNHPYFPLRKGYEIAYRHPDQSYLPEPEALEAGKGTTDIAEDTEVIKVTRVNKGSVELSSLAKWKETVRSREEGTVTTSKEERLTQTVYCKKEGLQGLGDINMTPEKMASLAVGKDLNDFVAECGRAKVVGYSGVYLPRTLTSRSEWKNTFRIKVSTADSATGCEFDLTTSSTYKALGAHPIKVGKKTYTGIAVGVWTDFQGTSSKYPNIAPSFGPRVMYWVKGLGFVQISDIYGNITMTTERVKR